MKRGAALVVAGLLLAASAAAQTVLRDDRGVEVRLARPPQRIVTLLPSLTETVCALGACARLVGVDRFSNWPPSVASLPRLGGLEDPQVERVVALKPDLVLAPRSSRVVERLESLGLQVAVLDSDSHADVRRSIDLVARALGTPAEGERLWAGIERELAEAVRRVPSRWRGRSVYYEVASTPHAAGATSFIGQTMSALGLANIVPAALGPFPQLNPEFIVRAQPAVVMAGADDVKAMVQRPGWSGLEALRLGHVCAFDPARSEMLVRPGPRLGEGAAAIADCLSALR